MKIRHSTSSGQDKIELQMTPMIDIVFQLLVFFVMLFKVVSTEGDFNIKMPQASPSSTQNIEPESLPNTLVLTDEGSYEVSGSDGGDPITMQRVGLLLNGETYGSFPEVNEEIIRLLETAGGPAMGPDESAEIELEFEETVIYENVIGAITAVSGYRLKNGDIVPLIEKIRFAAPDGNGPNINE